LILILIACVANIVLLSLLWPAHADAQSFVLSVSGSDGLWLLTSACFYLVVRLLERAASCEADSQQII
jgi:hypothetical protein